MIKRYFTTFAATKNVESFHDRILGLQSEALFLRWDNVDFANRIVSTDQTKNYKARQIPLSEFAISWLGQLVRYVNCPFCFCQSENG